MSCNWKLLNVTLAFQERIYDIAIQDDKKVYDKIPIYFDILTQTSDLVIQTKNHVEIRNPDGKVTYFK